jgi:hypothetical protein
VVALVLCAIAAPAAGAQDYSTGPQGRPAPAYGIAAQTDVDHSPGLSGSNAEASVTAHPLPGGLGVDVRPSGLPEIEVGPNGWLQPVASPSELPQSSTPGPGPGGPAVVETPAVPPAPAPYGELYEHEFPADGTPVAPVAGAGFDWSDFGIGIAAGLVASALLAGAMLVHGRNRGRLAGA